MPLMRSRAIMAARLSSTPAILVRYSMVPRLSSIGLQAAEQAAAAASSAASSSFEPTSALAGLLDQQHGRRHGAQADAGVGALCRPSW